MKAIYNFEEALMQEHIFEPRQEGYNIDDLNEKDREHIAGMIWVLTVIKMWKFDCEQENENNGTVGKIHDEYLQKAYEKLVQELEEGIQQTVVSMLDSYDGNDEGIVASEEEAAVL